MAVECQATTGLEDPPTRLVELVWTGDDGWVWHVQPEGELGSLDYSPQGQYVVFTSNSQYGRPHHVTSYHADLGWGYLTRRERGSTGDDLVAAISDAGNVVVLRGAGFEDEPGYWFGGRLSIETYNSTTRRWTQRLTRDYPDGGIDPSSIDLAAGRVFATLVQSRSTGKLNGLADRVVLLSGRPDEPAVLVVRVGDRQVLTSSAAITRSGVGVAAWQAVEDRRSATPWFATWARGPQAAVRARPSRGVPPSPTRQSPGWRWTCRSAPTATAPWRTSDIDTGSTTRPSRPPSSASGATAPSRRRVDATWQQPVEATVDVTASASSTSITLGRMLGPFFPSPLTYYGVHP